MRKLIFFSALASMAFFPISGYALQPAPDGEPPPSCTGGEKPVCVKETCGGIPAKCVCSQWQCQWTAPGKAGHQNFSPVLNGAVKLQRN